MRQLLQARLNRVVFVDYHPVVVETGRGDASFGRLQGNGQGRIDMEVSGLSSLGGAIPLRSPSSVTTPSEIPAAASSSIAPKDELEISSAARMAEGLSEVGDSRTERLARIKAEIEAGSYDTDEKLDVALSRMFDSLGFDFDDE